MPDDGGLAAGGLHQPRQPALKTEPVDEDKLRIRNSLGVGRCRRVDVRVAIRANQRRDVDAVAADIADEIAEDGKAGDDVEPVLRPGRTDGRDQSQTDKPTQSPHLHASRCRPGNICRTSPLTLPNNTETTYSTAATRMMAGPDGMRVWNDSTRPA